MLLAVDIGNTQTTLGFFPADGKGLSKKLTAEWRVSTRKNATADEYGTQLLALFSAANMDLSLLRGVVVASVVPPVDDAFRLMIQTYLRAPALFIGPGTKTGINILYKNPAEVGADRIANAVGAHARVQKACIVIDFGTATTFDCVNAAGDYMGGAIVPGPEMAAQALSEKTAKLPYLSHFQAPKNAIGKSTSDSISSGLYYGYKGLIQEILAQLKKEMISPVHVLATGGLAPFLVPAIRGVRDIVPHLTLDGLRIIWERNQKRS